MAVKDSVGDLFLNSLLLVLGLDLEKNQVFFSVWQGERLSHAVGCAFAACLERKQKREKECGVTATFDANRTTFTREGSFRVTTATEAAEREEVMRQLQDAKKGP